MKKWCVRLGRSARSLRRPFRRVADRPLRSARSEASVSTGRLPEPNERPALVEIGLSMVIRTSRMAPVAMVLASKATPSFPPASTCAMIPETEFAELHQANPQAPRRTQPACSLDERASDIDYFVLPIDPGHSYRRANRSGRDHPPSAGIERVPGAACSGRNSTSPFGKVARSNEPPCRAFIRP